MYDATNRFKDEYTYYLISETDQEILIKERLAGSGSVPWITTRWSSLVLRYGAVVLCYRQCQPSRLLNLTVQLILENAEMAISGSYVYDDDGVFNPDNITIQPGTFIPAARVA